MRTDLQPNRNVQSDHPDVIAFTRDAIGAATTDIDRAIRLFTAVRDGIRYDPYVPLVPETLPASFTIERGANYCIPKAVLLAACARHLGIPAKLGFADVRNHLATPKLIERLGSDLFVFHGYTVLELGGRWVKATPTFNSSLCDKFGVPPLDFDGVNDALFHAFDPEGNATMAYVTDRGFYDDVPWEDARDAWQAAYPSYTEVAAHADFESEALATRGA